jgi:hypothetical protein
MDLELSEVGVGDDECFADADGEGHLSECMVIKESH